MFAPLKGILKRNHPDVCPEVMSHERGGGGEREKETEFYITATLIQFHFSE